MATQFFSIDSFQLAQGGELKNVSIAYTTQGTLNANRSNVILVFHALTGSHNISGHQAAMPQSQAPWNKECHTGWWSDFVGPGKAIDTDHYFVVCANYLGGCYGSTGPASVNEETGKPYGASFGRLRINDIVDSQIKLLDHLAIDNLYAVVGPSLGGVLALNLATRYPFKVQRVISIACGLKATTLARAHNLEQIFAIENDPCFNGGDYYEGQHPKQGLALARMISHKTFVSLKAIEKRAEQRVDYDEKLNWHSIDAPLESFLLHQGRKLVERFDANTYLQLIAAWSSFDLAKDGGCNDFGELFSRCAHQKHLVISIDSDVCFYPQEQREIYDWLQAIGIDSDYVVVRSDKGHDSFLLEPHLYSPFIEEVLGSSVDIRIKQAIK